MSVTKCETGGGIRGRNSGVMVWFGLVQAPNFPN